MLLDISGLWLRTWVLLLDLVSFMACVYLCNLTCSKLKFVFIFIDCFRRKLSGSCPRRDISVSPSDIVLMQKRTITWSQLLSTTDKPIDKPSDIPKKKVKEGSENGVITERANKTKETSQLLIIDEPIVIVASIPADAVPPENDKDKGKDVKRKQIEHESSLSAPAIFIAL